MSDQWYTATEAASMFRPATTDKTVRVHIRKVQTGSENGPNLVRMEQRGGKPVRTVSSTFLRELAATLDAELVEPFEHEQTQVQSSSNTEGQTHSNRTGTNRAARVRTGSEVSNLTRIAFEQFEAQIADLKGQVQRERELADEARADARRALELLEQRNRIEMTDALKALPSVQESPQDARTDAEPGPGQDYATVPKPSFWSRLFSR